MNATPAAVPLEFRPQTIDDWMNFAFYMRRNFNLPDTYCVVAHQPSACICAMKKIDMAKADLDKEFDWDKVNTVVMVSKEKCEQDHQGEKCDCVACIVALDGLSV